MVRLVFAVVLIWLLGGCGGGSDSSINQGDIPVGAYTVFDSENSDLPYPNDILFAPNSSSTSDAGDGTLNIPYESGDADASVKSALNALDGFSTISPISVGVTAAIDNASLYGHVRLFEVATAASPATNYIPAVAGTLGELTFGVDFVATYSADRLAIVPLKPLKSHASYMVVLTKGITTGDGNALVSDAISTMLNSTKALIDAQGNPTVYFSSDDAVNLAKATQLEGLRQLTQAMFAQLINQSAMECTNSSAGVACEDVIMAWSFTAQSIGDVQNALAQSTMQATLALGATGFNTKSFVDTLYGIADVYFGALSNLPQYMPQPSAQNPLPAIEGAFAFETGSSLPTIEANVTVAAVATVPNSVACPEPAAGWPVVIYQHGITRSRSDLLAFAETFAAKCYAAIAIDLPLHGITETNTSINPFYSAGTERTFNLDLVTEDADFNIIATTPDGTIDSTGAHYMNLTSLPTVRGNMHQSTSDLLQLENALSSAVGIAFDPSRIHFVSHSLGAMASTGYLNHTTGLKSATLAMPGQGILQILNNSAVFSPPLETGLAANGIIKGTASYDSFMLAAQTILDDADPANYAAMIGAKTLPILAFEAIGDGSEGSGDQHIPNAIATAPLSGTDPFLRLINATDINATNTLSTASGNLYFPATTKTVTRLVEGEHRSALDPQYSLAATTEIHTQMISFIDSNGTAILVVDPTVIKEK